MMQCYNYILYISHFANKGQIGCLDIIEHQHVYLVKIYIKSKKM
jgi:hypothetical protein